MGSATHRGPRKNNEDAVLCDIGARVVAVADGLGGHGSGEVASACAVEAIREFFRTDVPERAASLVRDDGSALELVKECFRRAHRVVLERAEGAGVNMMTTMVAAWFVEDAIVIGHVGDSRLYRLRDGTLTCLTSDHSILGDAVRSGADLSQHDPELVARLRNTVTRALGHSDAAEPAVARSVMRAGDVYLLCSDGVWGALADDQIRAALECSLPAGEVAETLVASALRADSRDNSTAAVVQVDHASDLARSR